MGLGVSAISRIGDSYSQSARDLPGYYLALDAGRLPVVRGIWLDRDDLLRRAVIGELMCHGAIDRAGFGTRHRLAFDDYFADDLDRLRVLANDGLVELSSDRVHVTARGRLLLRNIAMCFDGRLQREAPAVHYSRAI